MAIFRQFLTISNPKFQKFGATRHFPYILAHLLLKRAHYARKNAENAVKIQEEIRFGRNVGLGRNLRSWPEYLPLVKHDHNMQYQGDRMPQTLETIMDHSKATKRHHMGSI